MQLADARGLPIDRAVSNRAISNRAISNRAISNRAISIALTFENDF